MNKPNYSDFLGKRNSYDRDNLVGYWAPQLAKRRESIGHLYQIQRAVSQFVTIGTNGLIPGRDVEFKLIGDSYIDYNKQVHIRIHRDATIMVGLALHEASHCAYDDMVVFQSLSEWMKKPDHGLSNKSYFPKGFEEFITKFATKFGMNLRAAIKEFFNYLNWLADRRIDKIRVTTCPGYAGYYDSLYSEYFWRPEDSEILTGENFREETIRSYTFRIFTMLHPDWSHDALKRLPEIVQLIDLNNILRMGTGPEGTAKVAKLAYDIWNILYDACDELKNDKEVSHEMSQQGGDGQPGQPDSNPFEGEDEDSEDEKRRKTLQKIMNDFLDKPLETGDIEGALDSLLDDLSDPNSKANQAQTLPEKSLEQKKSFLSDDQLSETLYAISDKELAAIQAMIASSVKVSEVFNGTYHAALFEDIDKVEGLSVGFLSDHKGRSTGNGLDDAIRQGRLLGNRYRRDMLILNETKNVKTTRQKRGKIDGRTLYAADFDPMIYASVRKTKRQRVYLHLSLDASGSMDCLSRWPEAVKLATMLVYSTYGVTGFVLTISIRSNYGTSGSNDDPALAIVYDSRRHTPNKFLKNIRRITLDSSTPESLLYELASKFLHTTAPADAVKYFVTVTDGEPCFHGYSGSTAINHCNREIKKMNKQGIKVFGYYVGDTNRGGNYDTFHKMYGDNSEVLGDRQWNKIAADLKNFILYNSKLVTA